MLNRNKDNNDFVNFLNTIALDDITQYLTNFPFEPIKAYMLIDIRANI